MRQLGGHIVNAYAGTLSYSHGTSREEWGFFAGDRSLNQPEWPSKIKIVDQLSIRHPPTL